MLQALKRHSSLIVAAIVLTAGINLAATDAFAMAASAAGANGTAGGASGTAGGASGTGGGGGAGPGGGGGAPPLRCGANCPPPSPPRIAYNHWRPYLACAHPEPTFDRFGNFVGEIVVNTCFTGE